MRPLPSRRAVVAGLVAATAVGCTSRQTGAPPSPLDEKLPAPRAAVHPDDDGRSGTRVLQVLAHPDDDLYFMNPEVQQSLDDNDAVVSVYVNCGESGGRNKVPGGPPPRPDVAAYAGARRQGLRQAYALMATGDARAPWTSMATVLPGGLPVETSILDGHEGVQLVFLGVRQRGPGGRARRQGLPHLWADPDAVTATLVSTGSPVTAPHPVTRRSLIDALVHLLDLHEPTLVRMMDTDPDRQVHDAHHRVHHDQPGYSDHPDHTATALFTQAALAEHLKRRKGAPCAVVSYRGYFNERWPHNLPRRTVSGKVTVLNTYGGTPEGCDFVAGCGDYDVGRNRSRSTGWVQRTSHRHPTAAPRVRLDADGRLTAFAVLSGQAAMWQEEGRDGGTWSRARLLGGDGLLPGLTASLGKDGRWQLYAERIAELGAKARHNRREIVTTTQQRAGGPFGAWVSLGNPEHDPEHGRRVGTPVVATAGDGTTWLFVRNWAKGVSCRRRGTDGRWSAWQDLGGAEVQEGLCAVTDGAGRVHVFGSGRGTVHHWRQEHAKGPVTFAATGLPAPADPPTALLCSDGSLLLAYRAAGSAEPLAHRLPAGARAWRPVRTGLVARGYGALALHAERGGGVLLAARNNAGGTSLATLGTDDVPRWSTVTGTVVGAAALAADASGRTVLARVAPDATLQTVFVPGLTSA
ncbi:PIG-L family deacetylase [Streptomyces sp. NBC_00237]|uniref:PIG-L family deacetylase n=1 Tax=Streptomyces sp. NBC_00237 TaxID=2975687 RepID=UPI00225064E3|nr:PIG-L family deacetylase [Streptomyces sp. NBC_00237]MCX5200635.1 PIG-L family deacetylase [Streptomyces sp. NBC_00237]